jgi:hypothetical protein
VKTKIRRLKFFFLANVFTLFKKAHTVVPGHGHVVATTHTAVTIDAASLGPTHIIVMLNQPQTNNQPQSVVPAFPAVVTDGLSHQVSPMMLGPSDQEESL